MRGGEPQKTPLSKTRTNNKLNPNMALGRNRSQATLVGSRRTLSPLLHPYSRQTTAESKIDISNVVRNIKRTATNGVSWFLNISKRIQKLRYLYTTKSNLAKNLCNFKNRYFVGQYSAILTSHLVNSPYITLFQRAVGLKL